jgi:hypothetical protein
MARKDPRRNISRIAQTTAQGQRILGWMVRLRNRGEQTARFFNDVRYGGNRQALQAAKTFRDELEQGRKPYTVRELAQRPSIRNASGTVGIRRHQQVDTRGESQYRYEYWVAQWIDGLGHRKTRMFSIRKYGNREAKKMALAARRQGVRKAKR